MEGTTTEAPKPFHLYDGIVFLRSEGMPSLAASLVSYNAESCKCMLKPTDFDSETEQRWRQRLKSGQQVEFDMAAPPYLSGLHLRAVIKDVDSRMTALELMLNYVDIEAQDQDTLRNAVNTVHTSGTGKTESAAEPVAVTPDRVAATSGMYDSGVFRAITSTNGKRAPAIIPDAGAFRGKKLGEILVQTAQLSQLQADAATMAAKSSGEKLGRYLLRTGLLTSIELCRALSYQSDLPIVELSKTVTLPAELISKFSFLHMLRHEYVPFEQSNEAVSVATLQPLPRSVVEEIQHRCKKSVSLFLGEDDQIVRLLYTMQPKKDRKMRKTPRFSLKVPIAVRLFDQDRSVLDDTVHYGKTLDISEAGTMIATHYAAAVNSSLHLSFTFAPYHLEALATVRHVAAATDPESDFRWMLGVHFTEMTQDARANLGKVCARLRMWNIFDHTSEKQS
jgi:hypothetical protein